MHPQCLRTQSNHTHGAPIRERPGRCAACCPLGGRPSRGLQGFREHIVGIVRDYTAETLTTIVPQIPSAANDVSRPTTRSSPPMHCT
jgi:hypothetical protein